MISQKHHFIFVHVPRTGGNTVQNVLQQYSEDKLVSDRPHQDGIERFGISSRYPSLVKHSPLRDILTALGTPESEAYRVAVTRRNPYDRAISHYFFKQSMPYFRSGQAPLRADLPFHEEEFIALVPQLKAMRTFLGEPGADALTKVHLESVKWLLCFETLQTSLNQMLQDLNLPETSLRQHNASYRKASYREYYTPACRTAVEAHFGDELALFGYTF